MLLTYSSAVIGLVTVTVIGTVLPFSTSGGTSSLTLPVRTGASPATLRMAPASVAGVASAGRADAIQPFHTIVRRHDGCGIEARRIDEPKPELSFGPAAARAGKARREIA